MINKQKVNYPRKITILGSTGTIGVNTLDLINKNLSLYHVEALTAFSNFNLLSISLR